MARNDDWLADVRRWYFDERSPHDAAPLHGLASEPADDGDPIGYEAAWPVGDDASPGVEAARLAGPDLP